WSAAGWARPSTRGTPRSRTGRCARRRSRRLAELLQDRHRRPERGPLLGGQLGQPPGQPGVLAPPDALDDRPPFLGDGEDHLPPAIRRAVASPASVLVRVAVIIGYLRRQAWGVD